MPAKLVRVSGIAAFVLGASFALTPLAAVAEPEPEPPSLPGINQCDEGSDCGKPKPPEHCKPEECPPPPCKPGECEEVKPPPEVAPPPAAPPEQAPAPAPAPPPQQQAPAPQQSPQQQRPQVSPTQQKPTHVPTAKPQMPKPTQQVPQVEHKPTGGVQAGGGATAQENTDNSGPLLAVSGLALTALAAGGAHLYRRRSADQRS
ncbi:hypothetical protein [Saccharopolyspora oryzae]|uniref:LPXTG-motif cell wall-anchored protein n=1 Tax=Saccharopolyspora oryzae TaxID=2997343 RepID=A0ABT4V936_9PSEU|nr:hypothetical protein [Saccharopolyspora oryzae]MDA3630443.1 hypothetical protein [Saccharopolyspora oryzae]